MSCIVWKCNGLWNQLAVQELVNLVQEKVSSILFLAETLANEARLDYMKDQIHFDNKFFVQRVNKGGRRVLYWKNNIEVDVESSSLNHINATINKNSREAWHFTGFYGVPKTHKRQESWDLLHSLHSQSSHP